MTLLRNGIHLRQGDGLQDPVDDDLRREWNSPRRVFLFVTSERSDRVRLLLGSAAHVFAQVSGKQILSNQP